jgi:hypothetical protein
MMMLMLLSPLPWPSIRRCRRRCPNHGGAPTRPLLRTRPRFFSAVTRLRGVAEHAVAVRHAPGHGAGSPRRSRGAASRGRYVTMLSVSRACCYVCNAWGVPLHRCHSAGTRCAVHAFALLYPGAPTEQCGHDAGRGQARGSVATGAARAGYGMREEREEAEIGGRCISTPAVPCCCSISTPAVPCCCSISTPAVPCC